MAKGVISAAQSSFFKHYATLYSFLMVCRGRHEPSQRSYLNPLKSPVPVGPLASSRSISTSRSVKVPSL